MNAPFVFRAMIVAVAALLFMTTVHGSARADLHPHERDGWMLGLGIGGGGVAIKVNDETSDREGGGTAHFRAGYILTPRVSIGVEANAWYKEIQGVAWSFTTFTAAATVYPGDGFTLRAGIGSGSAEAALTAGNTTTTTSESGLGFSTGVGYEIRVSRSWAVVPQIDFSFISLDSFDANYPTLSVAAHWYILPK